jgi:Ca2+-binding RTX toxin-like protein
MGKKKDKHKVIYGDEFANEITGTDGNDKIAGLGGDDTIEGGAGNDQIWGDSNGSGKGTGSGKGSHKASKASHGGSKASHRGSKASDGEPGNDYLDGGAGNDKLWGGAGDDIAAYNVTENEGAKDKYDGGKGTDTLILMMTAEEWYDEDFQKGDLANYLAVLANPHDKHKKFHFESFNLDVKKFENVEWEETVDEVDPDLVDDIFRDLTISNVAPPEPVTEDIVYTRTDYVFEANLLGNDVGILNVARDDLNDSFTFSFFDVPSYMSIEWNADDLNFIVHIDHQIESGGLISNAFLDDVEGGIVDPAGASFVYAVYLGSDFVDSATVDLFLAS